MIRPLRANPRILPGARFALLRWLLCSLIVMLSASCSDGSKGRVGAVDAVTNSGGAAKEPSTAASQVRVALIMKTLTNPFFVEMERGARRAQREAHIDLQVKTATQETSIEQQIQLVDSEIKAHSEAIVIAPGDSSRLVPILKQAQDAGIQIVNVDNRLSAAAMSAAGMKPVPFVSVDNEAGAYQAAAHLASLVLHPTQAAILEGIRSADNAQQRKLGAQRGFKSNPKIRLVASETANWKIDEAYAVTARLFKQYPGIGVLFCANDMMAFGAVKYLQESGRRHVLVAGFDALDEANSAIRAGQLEVTVDQQAAEQGYIGIRTALQLLAGQTVPMELQVDAKLVTATSLK
jgi:ribose transport system substrate-binding protein